MLCLRSVVCADVCIYLYAYVSSYVQAYVHACTHCCTCILACVQSLHAVYLYIYIYTIRCTYIQIPACELMHGVNSFLYFVLTSERGIVFVVVC